MKKEAIFDLFTGAYLLLFAYLLLSEISFDIENLGYITNVMTGGIEISSYLFMPAISEFFSMFIFFLLFYVVFLSQRNLMEKKRMKESKSRKVDLHEAISTKGMKGVERSKVVDMAFPFGFLLVFYAGILYSLYGSFPSSVTGELASLPFVAFIFFSFLRIGYSFFNSIIKKTGESDYALEEYVSKNKSYFIRTLVMLLIVVSSFLLLGTVGHVLFAYYFGGGIFFLGLFVYGFFNKPK